MVLAVGQINTFMMKHMCNQFFCFFFFLMNLKALILQNIAKQILDY